MNRDDFRKIPELRRSIKKDEELLELFREMATSTGQSLPDTERVQTSVTNRADVMVVEAADLEREIAVQKKELAELVAGATSMIDLLTRDDARRVMLLRYQMGLPWDLVATSMHFSRAWARHLELVAFEKMEI